MTILPPDPDEPRLPLGPRDPGDAWVVAESGQRYWGRFGAAGLLAFDAARGVLLQHRVGWSHFGGTWGLPGGALHEGEAAMIGAQREAQEEAGIPDGAVRPRATSVFDLRIWSYTTVIADVIDPFEPMITDAESVALEWVPVDAVNDRELHPGFQDAWPALQKMLAVRPALVVDAANVVGAVPDGWWKDRAGAADRLRAELAGLSISANALGLLGEAWFPEISLVVEGRGRDLPDAADDLTLVRAPGSGDDAILAEAQRLLEAGRAVTVITSDRELRARVEQAGAATRSSGWLRALLD